MNIKIILKNIPGGYSIPTIQIFHAIENNNDIYRDKDCMKKYCESLRKHSMKIINFENKKMIPLTNEQEESYEKTKI